MNIIHIFVFAVLVAVALLLARIAVRLWDSRYNEERQLDASAHTVARLISRRLHLSRLLGSSLLTLFAAAILTCGPMGMMLTSCSKIDNPVVTPAADDDNYTIVVDPNMEMPYNAFETEVPAVAGDPAVVSALKAIDGVIDAKPFMLTERFDYYNLEYITKTAYYFNFKQPVDHNNPSRGWFKQQCVLTLAGTAGNSRPTVLHTQGYALGKEQNRLDMIGEPALVSVLEANCLQVEYRYHGWSLPEGYTNNFHYLTAKQQSDDLHAIVTAIKQSGLIGASSKWVSTGVSKNGMTTAHYAYHYPNEMDAYVPFCAPFLLSLTEKGPYSYILSKEAFDNDTEEMEKVKAAIRAYVGDRALQAEVVNYAKQSNPFYAPYSDEDVRLVVLAMLFNNYFNKMSYVNYARWEYLVPKAGDSFGKFVNFIVSDASTRYDAEKEEEYKRRKETVEDLEPGSTNPLSPLAPTRAATVARYDAYYVQVCIELGGFVNDLSWVEDLLTPEEKQYLTRFNSPDVFGVTYDGGKFIREFFEGMKQSTCPMMFVYGMQDPWTGGQIPDDCLGPNSQKLYIHNGTHNDYIDKWNASERNQLFHWLNGLGFDL